MKNLQRVSLTYPADENEPLTEYLPSYLDVLPYLN
jgi:hypothetical protein